MNKKILWMTFMIAVISVLCFACGNVEEKKALVSIDEKPADIGVSYEVAVLENEIIIYEVTGNIKEIIKKGRYMPARENDLLRLRDGIECETKEEALKIFEDFVS